MHAYLIIFICYFWYVIFLSFYYVWDIEVGTVYTFLLLIFTTSLLREKKSLFCVMRKLRPGRWINLSNVPLAESHRIRIFSCLFSIVNIHKTLWPRKATRAGVVCVWGGGERERARKGEKGRESERERGREGKKAISITKKISPIFFLFAKLGWWRIIVFLYRPYHMTSPVVNPYIGHAHKSGTCINLGGRVALNVQLWFRIWEKKNTNTIPPCLLRFMSIQRTLYVLCPLVYHTLLSSNFKSNTPCPTTSKIFWME